MRRASQKREEHTMRERIDNELDDALDEALASLEEAMMQVFAETNPLARSFPEQTRAHVRLFLAKIEALPEMVHMRSQIQEWAKDEEEGDEETGDTDTETE
jgi:hypothetical protein